MEQAVQLAVAAAKAGLAGASSDECDLFRDQLLQGTEPIFLSHVSTWNILISFGIISFTHFRLY